jgi:Secretion system C-terminal sorting domain/FG-GAP-like repeat
MRQIFALLIFFLTCNIAFSQLIQFNQVTEQLPHPQNIIDFEMVGQSTVVFADVDNDTDPDALVLGFNNSNQHFTKLHINDGLGNFAWDSNSGIENLESGTAAFSDIDGDSDQDLIITGNNLAGIPTAQLYENDGLGNFTLTIGTPFQGVINGYWKSAVVFSDVDEDGDNDVWISGHDVLNDGLALLYLNDGTGAFSIVNGTSFLGGYGELAVSDIDNDGDEDVLMTGIAALNLYTNDGSGNFTLVNGTPFGEVDDGSIVFSDLDLDGDQDVLVLGNSALQGYIANLYSNDGNGGFTLTSGTPFEGVWLSAVGMADIENDGDLDILVSGRNVAGDKTANLYRNIGLNSFELITPSAFLRVDGGSVVFSDIDSDGDKDVIMSGTTSVGAQCKTTVYINDGSGNYSLVKESAFTSFKNSVIAFSDLDGDGDNDVIGSGESVFSQAITDLYLNDGSGYYTPLSPSPFEQLRMGSLAVGDVDGDNDNDIVSLGMNMVNERKVNQYMNDGSGSFSLYTSQAFFTFTPTTDGTITFSDVDGDNDDDALITGMSNSTVITQLYKNDGLGNFEETGPSFDGLWKSSVAFKDIDNDGDNDLLLTGGNAFNDPIANLYSNDGAGNFTGMMGFPIDPVINGSVAFSDIENDGDADFLIVGLNAGGLLVSRLYENDGLGTFSEVIGTPFVGVQFSSIEFFDVNSDGDEDLLITGLTTANTAVSKFYSNNGLGQFTEVNNLPFDNVYKGFTTSSDIDLDGDMDVIISGLKDDGTTITKLYRNQTAVNPPFVINTFVLPSSADSCTGILSGLAEGNPDFEFNIENGLVQVTSSGHLFVDELCQGVYTMTITDNITNSHVISFIIPVDSNYIFNNPFIDSIAVDSLGATIEDCDIYYNGIDTAFIDSIFANGNTVTVIWNIVDSNGSNFDTSNYVLNNGNGVYYLQLSVFCPTKSLGEYFTVTEAVYLQGGYLSLNGPMQLDDLFELFPNPTNDVVTLRFEAPSADLVVFDAQGKRIQTHKIISGDSISLSHLETGVYFFELTTEKGKTVKRVVKQ